MGYRPPGPQGPQGAQGAQPGGYGQPELRPGVPVTSADGQWKGTVVEVLPTGRGYEGTVRVQWEGYGLTYVTLSMLGYDNGRFVVRADGSQAQAAQNAGSGQGAQNAAANLAGSNDATEIRSRVSAPQPADEGSDLTVLPNTSRPQRPETNAGYAQPSRPENEDDFTVLPNTSRSQRPEINTGYSQPAQTGNEGSEPTVFPGASRPQQPDANIGYGQSAPINSEMDDLTVLPNTSRSPRPDVNAGYPQPARGNDDATRLSSPEPANVSDAYPAYPVEPVGEDVTRLPQTNAREMPQTPSYPTYPPLRSNPADVVPYYTPRPDEQMEADDITRLPHPGIQVTPGPTPRPSYPAPQPPVPVMPPAPPVQPAHPVSSYYPEAPPLPDTAQRRPAAEPAYVAQAEQTEITVPVIEEQLSARPEWHDAGNITVRTQTEEVPQTFTQQVEREEAFVERVSVGRILAEGETVEPRQEGDTFIMPVIVEEAVVITRRVLAEEVRITKRTVQTTQTVQTTTRRQRAEVDSGSLGERVHDDRTSS